MKFYFTLAVALCLAVSVFSQNYKLKPDYKVKPGISTISILPVGPKASESEIGWPSGNIDYMNPVLPPKSANAEGARAVNIVDLGSSANILTYGERNGANTYTFYNKELNVLTNVHRMGGEVGPPGQYSGDLCYDISYDGGMTWTNQIKIYESNISGGQYNTDAARFPEAVLYNPPGNTDPANAYLVFFAANLDGTNGGDWGGYSYGVANLGDPSDTTKHLQSSDLANGFYQGIPFNFNLIPQSRMTFMADASLENSTEPYLGDIIMMRGQFDEDLGDFVYEKSLVPAPAEYARYLKSAFDPSGQTGYVYWNYSNGSISMLEGWQYPLLLKTNDGGETWSDVISVELCGPDGIDAVKNWMSDEMIAEMWEAPVPTRDEIMYSTPWWNTDIAVDAWGNPHLATVVHVAGPGLDPGFIAITPETFAMFDLYSIDDDNEQWYGIHLGTLNSFEGEFEKPGDDPLLEYNRPEISSSSDGSKLFFTWLDTRLENVEDNTAPDIYARGFDVVENATTYDESASAITGATNVTNFSEAMWQAYFKSTFVYCMEEGEEGSMTYTIPMTYADMNPLDILDPVRFKYIQDYTISDGEFVHPTGNPPITTIGIDEIAVSGSKGLINNLRVYPNPFSNQATVAIELKAAANVKLELISPTGARVLSEEIGYKEAGTLYHTLNRGNLKPGFYIYNVFAGKDMMTGKLVIE